MTLPVLTAECRLVAEPELRFSPSGLAVANIRLAANSAKKDENDKWVDDKTLWLRATAFGEKAEWLAENFVKGQLVVATGRIHTAEWETDGVKRQALEMILDALSPSFRQKRGGEESSSSAPAAAAPAPTSAPDPEEPPF